MMNIRVTVADVAREAQVSKTTAASILRNTPGYRAESGTRDRVAQAARALGYRRNGLAVALSSGRTHTIGVLLPLSLPALRARNAISRAYAQDVFMAVFNAASNAGLRTSPIPIAEAGRLDLHDVLDGRLDGMILVSYPDADTVSQIHESGLAYAEIGSGHGRYLVSPDHAGGMTTAVAHLVEMGHRRIAYWRGTLTGNSAGEGRLRGFQIALGQYGLCQADCPVLENVDGVKTWLGLPRAVRPTALCTFNDHTAIMALDMARAAGLRVPEDLSLVGFDDNVLAETARPGLTTVHNPLDEQAKAAIVLLQRQWQNEEELPQQITIPVHLVVRHSTAPPESALPRPFLS